MRFVHKLLILSLCVLASPSWAQDQAPEYSRALENYMDNSEGITDYSDLEQQSEDLKKHPVNLNEAGKDVLARITLLSPAHIEALLTHRRQYGRLGSVYEIQVIEGFTTDLIQEIKQYIQVSDPLTLSGLKADAKQYHHELVCVSSRRLEKAAGYSTDISGKRAYAGSPYQQVIRYRASAGGKISMGFTVQKPASDPWTASSGSFSLQLHHNGKLRQLVIGHFQAAFGQGLTFGSGLTFGKSGFVLNVMRSQNHIKPNRSINKEEALGGLAAVFKLSRRMDLSVFYSSKILPAAKTDDEDTNVSAISSSIDKDRQQIAGGHLSYTAENSCIGLTAASHYAPTDPSIKKPYRIFDDVQPLIHNVGIDYKIFRKNVMFFGECASNGNIQSLSFLNGLVASLDKTFDISIVQRYYGLKYQAPVTNAFGESQDNQNESGVYMACSYALTHRYKVKAYADIYRFDWLRYQVDAPSGGRDMLLELQYAERKRFNWYIRYRNEDKQKNEAGTQSLNRLESNRRELLRFHMELQAGTGLMLKSRIEHVWHHRQFGKTTSGMLILQDVQVQVNKKLKLLSRLMFFDVEDFNSRVYAFENDVMYTYTVPAFQHRGIRFYILLKYKMTKNIHLCFRFARTSMENAGSSGSGPEKINGNTLSDTRIQFLWNL
jgi:hypothetical protein